MELTGDNFGSVAANLQVNFQMTSGATLLSYQGINGLTASVSATSLRVTYAPALPALNTVIMIDSEQMLVRI